MSIFMPEIKCADCGTQDFIRTKKIDDKGITENSRYVFDTETGQIICGLCLDIRRGETRK